MVMQRGGSVVLECLATFQFRGKSLSHDPSLSNRPRPTIQQTRLLGDPSGLKLPFVDFCFRATPCHAGLLPENEAEQQNGTQQKAVSNQMGHTVQSAAGRYGGRRHVAAWPNSGTNAEERISKLISKNIVWIGDLEGEEEEEERRHRSSERCCVPCRSRPRPLCYS